jgi:chromate transporter
MSTPTPPNRPASLAELFVAFTLLALKGYGGLLAMSQRVLCDEKRWLSQAQYVDALGVAHVLPGSSVCNLALIVGNRFFGWRGALAALAGLTAVPLAILLALATLYARFAPLPPVAGSVRGIGAVSAGIVIGTALRLAPALRRNAMRLPACIAFVAAAFIGMALLHWPLIWVVAATGTIACAVAWYRLGDKARTKHGATS